MSEPEVKMSESETLPNRLQSYKISVSPTAASLVQVCLERMLKEGMITLDEVDAVGLIRGEVKKGLDEYNLIKESTEKRLNELKQEEEQKVLAEKFKSQEREKELLNNERRLRKSLESQVASLNEQLSSLSKPVSKTSVPNLTKTNVTSDDEIIQVVIPTSDELEKMTKSEIMILGKSLGFELNRIKIKKDLIAEFEKLSSAKVKELLAN